MIAKENYGKVVNFMINIFLGIGLTLTGLLKGNSLTVLSFLQGFVVSMGCGYTICDVIPQVGTILCRKIDNKIVSTLLGTAVNGLIYIFFISLCCQFVNFGLGTMQIWPHVFPFLYVVGYLILIVFMPVSIKAADFLTTQK